MRVLFIALCVALSWPGAAVAQSSGNDLRIEWEVKNRFRLFRDEADFQRHVAAYAGDGVLAAEERMARASDGRGWARDTVERLCVDRAGKLLEICQRDGVREHYLSPQDHRITVRLAGSVTAGSTCAWTFDDGETAAQKASLPCDQNVTLRLRYGRPTIAAVGITAPDDTIQQVTTEIMVRDVLIAGVGDSIAAGEGNPDRAVPLDDGGFCFRRFLGTGSSEYFRPGRAGYRGNRACLDVGAGDTSGADDWGRYSARWMSAACHSSLYGHQIRTALELAVENTHLAVTYIPLACSGASINAGLLGPQAIRECQPARVGSCTSSVPGQIVQLQQMMALAQRQQPGRQLDLVLLTVGANDIDFSGLVADVIVEDRTERALFNRVISSVARAETVLERELPASFAKLRAALSPVVGGNFQRVVYVSYSNPALEAGGKTCPGGRLGFDIHPAFAADPVRLGKVADFVSAKFLPKLRTLAEPMTFVDAHQDAFADHGFCAQSDEDPAFDRECFLPDGGTFESDLVRASTDPLICPFRASDFRAYAPRARWIRTPNDSYFTAMTYPYSSMQPANIHDAAWGVLSAVYGGAVHPTAQGQAAMADAALPAVRALLGLGGTEKIQVEPLPPPASPEPSAATR